MLKRTKCHLKWMKWFMNKPCTFVTLSHHIFFPWFFKRRGGLSLLMNHSCKKKQTPKSATTQWSWRHNPGISQSKPKDFKVDNIQQNAYSSQLTLQCLILKQKTCVCFCYFLCTAQSWCTKTVCTLSSLMNLLLRKD